MNQQADDKSGNKRKFPAFLNSRLIKFNKSLSHTLPLLHLKSAETAAFQDACQKLGIPAYVIGDAKKAPGMALDAIHDAYHAVLEINE